MSARDAITERMERKQVRFDAAHPKPKKSKPESEPVPGPEPVPVPGPGPAEPVDTPVEDVPAG